MSNNFLIYKTEDEKISVSVRFDEDNETVWLSLDQLSFLFGRDKSTISRHIKNIFEEGELQRNSVVANFATVLAKENSRKLRESYLKKKMQEIEEELKKLEE